VNVAAPAPVKAAGMVTALPTVAVAGEMTGGASRAM
jgi:hypothetical protein